MEVIAYIFRGIVCALQALVGCAGDDPPKCRNRIGLTADKGRLELLRLYLISHRPVAKVVPKADIAAAAST